MFGLMTTREHERILAAYRTHWADMANATSRHHANLVESVRDDAVKEVRERAEAVIAKVESDRDGWRFLAQKLAGDLMEIHAKATPMPPAVAYPDGPTTGSVDDGDAEHTPSALKLRKAAR